MLHSLPPPDEAAARAYGQALTAFQCWHGGVEDLLAPVLREAPGFVMAPVLLAYLSVCSRDPRRVQQARPWLARAAALAAGDRERLHLAALAAALEGDHAAAAAALDALLARDPHDTLALQAATSFDYMIGDAERMLARVEAVLPAWSVDRPGRHAVLTTLAFALVECGEYERAEQAAGAALALKPLDIRAHHVMAHVFEMTDRAEAGLHWMTGLMAHPGVGGLLTTHCRWHLALFHLTLGRTDRALTLYDDEIRAGRSGDVADLIDAAALLWRIRLRGGEIGARAAELAEAWAPHIDDRWSTFNDLHAMLAFVAAGDWERAARLEAALARSRSLPTAYGATTRELGLPACHALIAFGRGDPLQATTRLACLPAQVHRLGGSYAQRDVLHLTLLQAVERLRRPVRLGTRWRTAVEAGLQVALPGAV